jgi:hypothetical protein
MPATPDHPGVTRTDKIRRILDLLTGSDDAPRSLLGDLKAREGRKVELEAERKAPASDHRLFHPSLAEVYLPKVAGRNHFLKDPTKRDESFDLVRRLIVVIRLVPENGELKVEVRGELAGILTLCGGHAKSRTLSDPAFACRQLKLVAGT